MNDMRLSSWQASGLTPEELDMLNEVLDVWQRTYARNRTRSLYYDAKNKLLDLGISIPPPLKRISTVVGWPEKAVDSLAERSCFDGFSFAGDADDDGLKALLAENDFANLYDQATEDELTHSCSFITVSKGGPGEPDVIISAYSALNAAAIWDYRRKRIRCGIAVVDFKRRYPFAKPSQVNFYTDEHVIEMRLSGNGRWTSERKAHSQRRPLMEPLRYRPTLDRPFGRSRINRAVMAVTDSAVREALRSEVAAEFAAAPQKYLMGADDSIFENQTKWDAVIGSMLAVSRDEEGQVPNFGQLPQMSMQPHTEYMRSLAARFSGETSVPISSLGVIHDNPASAEAIYAAKEDLVIKAGKLNRTNGASLRNVGMLVLAISRGVSISELTDDDKTITANFRNPAMPSIVSQSSAMVQQASAVPWLAETEVFLEELGYTEAQRDRMMKDKRKMQSRALLESQTRDDGGDKATMYEVQSIIKSYRSGKVNRKSALTLFGKVGIPEDEAGQILDDASDAEDTIGAIAKAVGGGGGDTG